MLTPEQSATVGEFLPLVISHARRHYKHRYEEGYDVSMDALIRAVKTYDPSRGSTLKTWIIYQMRGSYKNLRPIRERTGQQITLDHIPARPGTSIDDAEEYAIYQDRLKRLDPRSRKVVELRADGMKLSAIGDVFGVTKERTRQILDTAIERLQKC